ncbi:hypothetical protein D7V86_26715 [bacterium D16-51]|nr:hypothetical protein D7V96_15000 [bacterium D16-59]RKI51229.1 hypothetical protein D7V86_26715 [bacterium D16-51]
MISNQDLQESYLLTEIGVFANDPDKGEILYAVCCAIPEDAQKVLRYNGEFISNLVMSLNVKVSGESSVTFVSSRCFALQEDLEAVQKEMLKHALGEGLTFFVDADGILNVTYDDGEEETESETDNPGS